MRHDDIELQRQVSREEVWRRRRRARGTRVISVSLKGTEAMLLRSLSREFGYTGRSADQDMIRMLVRAAGSELRKERERRA